MTTELRWLTGVPAAACHAAAVMLLARPVAGAELVDPLLEPVDVLRRLIQWRGLDAAEFFAHLVPLSSGITAPRELAQAVLLKTAGREAAQFDAPPLAAALRELVAALLAARPALLDELELRWGPLRQQWEARGPGLLAAAGQMTDRQLVVERADVIVVAPLLGGGGQAHLDYNAVTIEAVLANPHPELPETVRLGWLLAQLNLDLPRFGETIRPQRRAVVAGLAMIPPILSAAEQVELAGLSAATLAAAIEAWHLPLPLVGQTSAAAAAALLDDWWHTYQQSRPDWAVSVKALDAMLADCGRGGGE